MKLYFANVWRIFFWFTQHKMVSKKNFTRPFPFYCFKSVSGLSQNLISEIFWLFPNKFDYFFTSTRPPSSEKRLRNPVSQSARHLDHNQRTVFILRSKFYCMILQPFPDFSLTFLTDFFPDFFLTCDIPENINLKRRRVRRRSRRRPSGAVPALTVATRRRDNAQRISHITSIAPFQQGDVNVFANTERKMKNSTEQKYMLSNPIDVQLNTL